MNKQDLRFAYLNYFKKQFENNELIDSKVLFEIATDGKIANEVLEELKNEELITGINFIRGSKNSLELDLDEIVHLTEKGINEINKLNSSHKVAENTNNKKQNERLIQTLIEREHERISKLSDTEKEEEIKIKILEYFQFLSSEINNYENKQISDNELKEKIKKIITNYFSSNQLSYAKLITKNLFLDDYITYFIKNAKSADFVDIDKLLTNKALSYLKQLEEKHNEEFEQYCKEHNIRLPKINIPTGIIQAYKNLNNPALIASINKLPAIYSAINNFGLGSIINQLAQIQSTLNTPYVHNVLNNLKSSATETAIKSAQKGLADILNSPTSSLYAKIIEQTEDNLDFSKITFKIKHLIINNFKNLKNINIDFTNTNNLLFIIGNNASGKSNILEAISAIFSEVYTNKKIPKFEYELIYQIGGNIITIKRHNNSLYYKLNNIKSSKKQIIHKDLLPAKIIALYSGEEMRLWEEYYRKFYHKYLKELTSAKFESFGNKMVYINKKYWNISLLTLLLSDSNDNKDFIKNKLNIDIKTVQININFDLDFIKNSKGNELKNFIKAINPHNLNTLSIKLSELKNRIFTKYKGEKENYIEKYSLKKVFEILVYALMPKSKKAFKNIEIIFNNGLSIKSLSEGEKKYILIYAIVDLLADEKTIILMDEPDAHIHEVGKKIICNLFEKYSSEYGRQIIVTTHSPTLTHCVNNNHLIMLENKDGYSAVINHEKIDKIKNLTGGIWSETKQNIFLNSATPLILFEGIGDIKYTKKAIELYKAEFPNLMDIDFLPFGGAQNACEYVKEIKAITPKNKKIIVIFDRDDEGQKGMKKCLPANTFERGRENYNTYLSIDNNIIYLMLPKTESHNYIDFVIEDYFSVSLKNEISQNKINEAAGIFNKYTKDLKQYIKEELAKEIYQTTDNMLNFKVLLKKISNIIEGIEDIKEV